MVTADILVVLHIIFAALWLGAPLAAAPALRMASSSGRDAFLLAALVAQRSGFVSAIGTTGVLVTGVSLIVTYGGFGVVGTRFHIALGLVLIAFILGATVLRSTSARIVDEARKETWTREVTDPLRKKLAMFGGISHTLWLAALILMYARSNYAL